MTQEPATALPDDPRGWLDYVAPTLERISPLYARLYRGMQQDAELFALLRLIDADQPIAVLFFSVVNFLLLEDQTHPFARFYPYLNTVPRPPIEAYSSFRAFCLAHRQELEALLPTARLQTNEVSRCAQLLPAFALVAQRGGGQPLSLIEIGTSAGLNLNWARYGYHYGNTTLGDPTSPVQLACRLLGEQRPPLPTALPPVAHCLGIELYPVDVRSEQDVRWLRGCIWPEELERHRLLDAALALARQSLPHLIAGDACEQLPALLAATPREQTLCVWHSFALNQGPAAVRERIIQVLMDASVERPISRIALEANPDTPGRPRLELWTYHNGGILRYDWLAECDFHGTSLRWLAADSATRDPRS